MVVCVAKDTGSFWSVFLPEDTCEEEDHYLSGGGGGGCKIFVLCKMIVMLKGWEWIHGTFKLMVQNSWGSPLGSFTGQGCK